VSVVVVDSVWKLMDMQLYGMFIENLTSTVISVQKCQAHISH